MNLFHKIELKERHVENAGPSPRFASRSSFKIAGYDFQTSSNKNANRKDIPQHWNQYHANRLYDKIGKVTDPNSRWDIGLLAEDDVKSGFVSYVIGIEVDDFNGVNDQCVKLTIPSAQYAVFNTPSVTAETFVRAIHSTWDYIYHVWLPQTGLVPMKTHEFETYCEASHSFFRGDLGTIGNIIQEDRP